MYLTCEEDTKQNIFKCKIIKIFQLSWKFLDESSSWLVDSVDMTLDSNNLVHICP